MRLESIFGRTLADKVEEEANGHGNRETKGKLERTKGNNDASDLRSNPSQAGENAKEGKAAPEKRERRQKHRPDAKADSLPNNAIENHPPNRSSNALEPGDHRHNRGSAAGSQVGEETHMRDISKSNKVANAKQDGRDTKNNQRTQ